MRSNTPEGYRDFQMDGLYQFYDGYTGEEFHQRDDTIIISTMSCSCVGQLVPGNLWRMKLVILPSRSVSGQVSI
jgi:hypothetical protein